MTDLFDFRAPRKHFALIGNPVAHSKSPQIHNTFARQLEIELVYELIQVEPGGFDQAVSHFSAQGGAGLNITLPFKVEAWQMCKRDGNSLSERAAQAESVNTIRFNDDGTLYGDNTDGIGLVQDIERNIGISIAGKRVLVVGAGGAVRGALGPILQARPGQLLVVNRTSEKATLLAQHFNQLGYSSIGGGLDLASGEFDLVINGTASSIGGELPDISSSCFGPNTKVYDMMYGQQPTLFMQWALAEGAGSAADGLGMLVEQAAAAFELWHHCKPETRPVIDALRKQ